ncbi:rRNA-processing protein Fcf1/Utp23 [Carpediemonas membranifera]|uniref:rRNA-processing protein Fcf1/Utp23 n=1 Tax=Carpediemonas membranifera TaxID=201153 RepID=A0A8J6E2G0_9EUKA|nr:rRNA-processing protein Fcf1/Utp23 [Carpediemonas membranifera]|eukprot:KAG9391867.1 rRNA-processing protein Fcf1/Utp23 [Carpediemonas membranifera]
MGTAKKQRKFAVMKKTISKRDARTKENQEAMQKAVEKHEKQVLQHDSAMFFTYNTRLAPPYNVLVDTSFLNQAIKHKLDLVTSMMDCLLAKCTPFVTDCIMNELERHGQRMGLALKLAKDPRVKRIKCVHEDERGYGDKCLMDHAKAHMCFIIATNDRDFRREVRKVPGIPIMYVGHHSMKIERLPDQPTA